MDKKAFYKLSYGLYIISTVYEGKRVGCIVNTLSQVTSTPAQVTVAINKDNYTAKMLLKSGYFAGVVLTEKTEMDLISEFGFKTSETLDKFQKYDYLKDLNDIPYIKDNIASRFSCKVVNTLDCGSHIVFLGEVIDSEVLSADKPMTYEYYREVKKGYTPPKASSYNEKPDKEEKKKGYRCIVCNYILESESIPPDFVCPICSQGPDKLVKL